MVLAFEGLGIVLVGNVVLQKITVKLCTFGLMLRSLCVWKLQSSGSLRHWLAVVSKQ